MTHDVEVVVHRNVELGVTPRTEYEVIERPPLLVGGSQVNDFANNGGTYPIPVLVFAAFQLMFAIITPALISGAVADRAKFSAWAVFVAIWSTVVYFPVAHWTRLLR